MGFKEIEFEVGEILDSYNAEVKAQVQATSKEVAKECAKKLRETSPKNEGNYAKGWTTKLQDGLAIVYNKTKPHLTHLLENGHAKKNKYGSYGFQSADVHIKPVEEWGNEEFERRIKNDLWCSEIDRIASCVF